MKIFRSLILAVTVLFTVSCAATFGLQSRLQKLSVGMSKKEVVRIMGNKYDVVHSVLTPEGEVAEIIEYWDGNKYEMEFRNDILVRFTKVPDPPVYVPAGKPHRPDHKH